MDTHLIHFSLVPAESLLISIFDNTVRTDTISMDFRLWQTSFPVPARWTCWIRDTNWDHHHGWHAYVIVTAILPIAASRVS